MYIGTPSLRPVMRSFRVPDIAMGVEVSHEDVVTTGVEVRVKSGREIRWTAGVMDVYGDLVDDGCATVVVQFSVQLLQQSLAGNI